MISLIKLISKIIPLVISPIFLFGCNAQKTSDKFILAHEIVQASEEDVSHIFEESIIKDECRKLQEEKIESYKEQKNIKEQEYNKLQEAKAAEEKIKKQAAAPKAQSKQNVPASKQSVQAPSPSKSEPAASKPSESNSSTATQAKYPMEYFTSVENEIVALCNAERSKIGAPALQINETLRKIARYKSNEMLQNNYFSHSSPVSGYMPWDLAKKTFGYSYSAFGENLWMSKMSSEDAKFTSQFKATITANQIVKDWMNSPGHKANILNKNFKRIGVGLSFSSKNKAYSAQEFSN